MGARCLMRLAGCCALAAAGLPACGGQASASLDATAPCRPDETPATVPWALPESTGVAHLAGLADLGGATGVLIHYWLPVFGPVGAAHMGPSYAMDFPDELLVGVIDAGLSPIRAPVPLSDGYATPAKPFPVGLLSSGGGLLGVWAEYPVVETEVPGEATISRVGALFTQAVSADGVPADTQRLVWGDPTLAGETVAGLPGADADGEGAVVAARVIRSLEAQVAGWAVVRVASDGRPIGEPVYGVDGGAGSSDLSTHVVAAAGEVWFAGRRIDAAAETEVLYLRAARDGAASIDVVARPVGATLELRDVAAWDSGELLLVWSEGGATLHATTIDPGGQALHDEPLATLAAPSLWGFLHARAHRRPDGGMVVTWTEPTADAAAWSLVAARLVAGGGASVVPVFEVAPAGVSGSAFPPVQVLVRGDTGLAAWWAEDRVHARRFCLLED